MSAIQILNNCMFDLSKIKTLWVGSRLVDSNPIVYPIQYHTISGSTDTIIAIEAWDLNNNIITIGSQQIFMNQIINTGDNISFDETLIIGSNGKIYAKTIKFLIPNLTVFLLNQIKEFTVTVSGLAQLAPTIALLEDENEQTLIVGYDHPLFLQTTDLNIGEGNDVTLSYLSTSKSRARAYQVLP